MSKLILFIALISTTQAQAASDSDQLHEAELQAKEVIQLSKEPLTATSEGCFKAQIILSKSDTLSKNLLTQSITWNSLTSTQTHKMKLLTFDLIEATTVTTCDQGLAKLQKINAVTSALAKELAQLGSIATE